MCLTVIIFVINKNAGPAPPSTTTHTSGLGPLTLWNKDSNYVEIMVATIIIKN